MTAQRKRLKPGDVLELQVVKGLALLLYIGRHPEYGDGVIVGSGMHERRIEVSSAFFEAGFAVFYPATAAHRAGLVETIGHVSPPPFPKRWRRAGARSSRRVETWIVEDELGESVKSTLSDDELRLPIAAIWNHEMLLHRIAEGWRPEREGAQS